MLSVLNYFVGVGVEQCIQTVCWFQ